MIDIYDFAGVLVSISIVEAIALILVNIGNKRLIREFEDEKIKNNQLSDDIAEMKKRIYWALEYTNGGGDDDRKT